MAYCSTRYDTASPSARVNPFTAFYFLNEVTANVLGKEKEEDAPGLKLLPSMISQRPGSRLPTGLRTRDLIANFGY